MHQIDFTNLCIGIESAYRTAVLFWLPVLLPQKNEKIDLRLL
jgi:hypothetical protein